jgi:hypothetical protein
VPLLLLRIDHPPGGQQLAVRGFTVDRASGDWYEEQQVESLLPREQALFDLARKAVLSTGDPEMTAQDAGVALWNLVAQGDVGQWWQATTKGAGAATVRTVLDVRPAELRSVPWELMAPEGRAPLFRNEHHPWVRAHTPWQTVDEMPVPVTVLVVLGDVLSTDLDVDEEIAAVHAALRTQPGRWNVEVLAEPGIEDLRRSLADIKPDVLHVIAHGMQKGAERVLALTDSSRRQWPLRRQDIDELPLPMPRLVLLNACRSAAAPEGQEASWTFADAFVDRGAAAVVAMQGDITSAAATQFSRTFYAELAKGVAIDVATALARRAVDDAVRTDNDERSWALPFLAVAADPDRILPVKVALDDEERVAGPPFSKVFAPVGSYVDRSSERRQLWRVLDPEPGERTSGLVLVTGQEQVGKSAVVLSALLTLRLRGRNVVYVDLSPPHPKPASWLTVLRRIRDAIWYWVPEAASEPRQRFDHELSFLKRYREPEQWTPESGMADDGEEFPSEGDQYHEWVERIFSRFHGMLQKAAADAPLLIVLDGLAGAFQPDITQWVAPKLLEPIGSSPRSCLSCVVVGTDRQLEDLTDTVRELAGEPLRVDPFKFAELPRLAREFYAREDLSLVDAPWWPGVLTLIGNAPTTGWQASALRTVLDMPKLWRVAP